MTHQNWKYAPLFLVSLAVLMTFAAWRTAQLHDRAGAAEAYDGNTLSVNGSRIPLYGIDAPELSQECKDKTGMNYTCGEVAKLELDKMARGRVECEAIKTEKYGREVSICRAGGVDLAAAMVSNGWAINAPGHTQYADQETAARKAKLGMWEGEFQNPWEFKLDLIGENVMANMWLWVREKML